jgi:hypothetical protein
MVSAQSIMKDGRCTFATALAVCVAAAVLGADKQRPVARNGRGLPVEEGSCLRRLTTANAKVM